MLFAGGMPDTISFDLSHPGRVDSDGGPEGLIAVRLLENEGEISRNQSNPSIET